MRGAVDVEEAFVDGFTMLAEVSARADMLDTYRCAEWFQVGLTVEGPHTSRQTVGCR